MPKKQINDYFFYKIVCLDSNIDLCYVGSTANWKARNNKHKSNCNNENSQKYNLKIYQIIRENGGWCNFKMIQIGKREQLTKRQAEQIEDEYRVELKANMNSRRCYLTEEQKQKYFLEQNKKYREENKDKILEQQRKYREENKDKIAEQKQKYYEQNKDKILEQHQKYYEENKDKISEQHQKYREENKDKINQKALEKFTCECGGRYTFKHKAHHLKTKKHQDHFKD